MAAHTDAASATQWHRLLGTLLEYFLTPVDIEVSTNIEVMSAPPEADILLLRRHGTAWSDAQKARLPDGIRDSAASHILIEFKYTESLNEQALRQAIGYDYFYQASAHVARQDLQTVVVSAKTPRRATLTRLGYERAGHAGVYRSRSALIADILLLVSNDLADTPYNAPITCFASRPRVKQQALTRLHTRKWADTPPVFWWFLEGLASVWLEQQGGIRMAHHDIAITPEMVTQLGQQMINQILSTVPVEDILQRVSHQELLTLFSPEERLRGLKAEERLHGLKTEERLQDLDIAEIERYLQQAKQQVGKGEARKTRASENDS